MTRKDSLIHLRQKFSRTESNIKHMQSIFSLEDQLQEVFRYYSASPPSRFIFRIVSKRDTEKFQV